MNLGNLNLLFIKDVHRYYLVNKRGKIKYCLPSTTIIINGIPDLKTFENPRVIYGTYVHELLEDYDKFGKKINNPELRAYIKFKKDYKVIVDKIESPQWSKEYLFAGALDRTMLIDGKEYIIDIKTGNEYDWHPIQLAAYSILTGIENRADLYLNNEKYEFVEHSENKYVDEFLRKLDVFRLNIDWDGYINGS